MKPFNLLIIFLFFNFTVNAQLAIVNDPDGYVNVRKEKNVRSQILGKINSGDIVRYSDEDYGQEWVWVTYNSKNSIHFVLPKAKILRDEKLVVLTGYIYKSKIVAVESLPRALYKKAVGYIVPNQFNTIDTITFSIKMKPFNLKNHKIQKATDCRNCNSLHVDKIDGNMPWGVDGNLPKREIADFSIAINGNPLKIPFKAYRDLFELGTELSVYYDYKGNIFFYMPNNSDGAGSYSVVWVVNNNTLISRYIDTED